MSTEQRENLEAILRQSAFPVGLDVSEQRRLLKELISAQPLPADVTVTAGTLGGVPTAEITTGGIAPRHIVVYFHGGVSPSRESPSAAGSPTPPWSTPAITGCPGRPRPLSCHRTST